MKILLGLLALGITTFVEAADLRTSYPIEPPRQEGYLQVSEKHQIFYALYGNPAGIPVVVLHGGPGMGCSDRFSRFFDLNRYPESCIGFVLTGIFLGREQDIQLFSKRGEAYQEFVRHFSQEEQRDLLAARELGVAVGCNFFATPHMCASRN